MIVEPKRDILLGPLVRAGVRRSWAARDHFLRLSIVPLVAMLAAAVPMRDLMLEANIVARAGTMPTDGGPMPQLALLSLCYIAALNVFAVNWIRQLTLGTQAVPNFGLSLGGRHLRFFLLIMATSIGSGVLAVVFMLFLGSLGLAGIMAGLMASLLIWVAVIVRISPTWIGIALDAPMRIGMAWRRTAGQGFKLLVALLAVEVPLLFVQQFVGGVFELTGFVALAPLTYVLFTALVQLVGIAVQLAIMVTAFPYFLRETV